jgi:hypothetical protein
VRQGRAMAEQGTFSVCRGVFDHPLFEGDAFSRREAWLWLVSEAAWKPRVRFLGRGRTKIELQRGQLEHTIRFMAQAWRWPETNVRRFLQRLAPRAWGVGRGAPVLFSGWHIRLIASQCASETGARHG